MSSSASVPVNSKRLVQDIKESLHLEASASVEDVISYVFDTHGKETYQTWANSRKLQYVAWLTAFALQWKRLDKPSDLFVNSANSSFCTVDVVGKGGQKTLFVKLVPKDMVDRGELDNPTTDNINGRVMNFLRKDPLIRKHTMNYIESFYTMMDTTKDEWPLLQTVDPNHALYPFSPSFQANGNECFCTVFQSISGHSVADVLEVSRTTGLHVIMEYIPDFAQALRTLGLKYGMMHNDMHLGNVFLSQNPSALVLIDYGRITFANPSLRSVIEKAGALETSKHHGHIIPNAYKQLTPNYVHSSRTGTDQLFFTHIFDLATFCMNIHTYIADMKLKYQGREWDWCPFCVVKPASGYMNIPASFADLQYMFAESMKRLESAELSMNQRRAVNVIAEGVFIMTWVLLYLSTMTSFKLVVNKHPSGRVITIKMQSLQSHRICGRAFQFVFFDESILETLYTSIKMDISNDALAYCPTLKNLIRDSMYGGRKKRGGEQVPESEMCTNSEVSNEEFLESLTRRNDKIPFTELKEKTHVTFYNSPKVSPTIGGKSKK